MLLAVRPHRGVSPLPKIVLELLDIPRAGSAPWRRVRYELLRLGGLLCLRFPHLRFRNTPVDADRSVFLHLTGDMGVDIQRGLGGYMTDDGGEGLHIHAMLQRHGGEGMPEVVESHSFAVSPFQDLLEPLSDIAGVDGLLRFDAGWEHQRREYSPLVFPQEFYHDGR